MTRATRSLPAALVILLAAAALITAHAQQPDAAAARVVEITAERFNFTPSDVTIAAGTTVAFTLQSEDTAHGFRIIGQSLDVTIPKRGRGQTTLRFTPPEPGTYIFECSRMCGAGHSFMRGRIRVTAETVKAPR